MSSELEIRELLPPETGLAFEAMRALRTDLGDEQSFVRQVDVVQRTEGYRLVAAFEAGAAEPSAAAGFRTAHSLAWGRYLYVDDLSTLPEARRRGHARALLDWLIAEGRRLDCNQFHLDSGVGIDRADAHRLYLNAGLVISAHHFARYVN
ncbi:MAG TPA: GNAT family N-acetyltransferase [Solirubrobacterales bacterium]|jgi:GNAT superfamily N-acetyltransferase|nr:GNAT family N-acetyltransferase [Solirubrobacterales bacterium]